MYRNHFIAEFYRNESYVKFLVNFISLEKIQKNQNEMINCFFWKIRSGIIIAYSQFLILFTSEHRRYQAMVHIMAIFLLQLHLRYEMDPILDCCPL